MTSYCCFKQGCELDVQYVCQCLSSVTYFCEFHLQAHLKLPNRTHYFDSVLTEPSEVTKDAALIFLAKEKAKKEKLKKIVSSPLNQDNKISLSDINSELKEIRFLIEKVSKVSDKDLVLNLSNLQHETDIDEAMLPNNSEECAEVALFCKLGQLRNKRFEILNRANNDPEIERDFRRACSLFENNSSNALLSQAYQEYISAYQKFTSTYLIDKKANLYIYNTEIENEEVKASRIPEELDKCTALAQLPNGELFFIGSYCSFCIGVFLIDRNYQIRKLPKGVPGECFGASYFNRAIYCFGVNSFRKFDLDQNRWSSLTPIRENAHCYCTSVAFNKKILIFREKKRKILLYSIDIDSFSEILYSFAEGKKILINAGERLYLIEFNGWIYESDIGNEYNWKQIAKSIIDINPKLVYCSYNKRGIYISVLDDSSRNYFKFDLNQKNLIEIGFYIEKLGIKRSNNELKVVKGTVQDSTLSLVNVLTCDKRHTLCYIGKKLNDLEKANREITFDDNCERPWKEKGDILRDLGRETETIECYNKAIKIDPYYADAYINKGDTLLESGRYLEAVECYNKAIKLEPRQLNYVLNNKGKALGKLARYDKAIKCYNKAIKIKHKDASAYNNKGEALYKLDRNVEAIECYNKAIKIKIDEPIFYRNRGNALSKLGRQIEALQDFNKADELMKDLQANDINLS